MQIQILSLTVALLWIGGCGYIAQESGSPSYPTDANKLTKDQIIRLTTDYTLIEGRNPTPVETFTNEFKNNSVVAEEKYSGKDVKLIGKINSVDNDISGLINVVLIDPEEEYALDSVTCNGVSTAMAKRLNKGQIVTVYGNVQSTDLGVIMNWCGFQFRNSDTLSNNLRILRNG